MSFQLVGCFLGAGKLEARRHVKWFEAMDRDALKVMLQSATTLAERTEAVDVAVRLGMSLREIEEYLDWLDLNRRRNKTGLPDHSPLISHPDLSP
jgi:hypothetical protein